MKYNIFISWSGPRSKWVAEALRDWLPHVLQASQPWLSSKDIDKGTRAFAELTKPLEDLKIGISCLTPENLKAPWLLYEAGVLTKTLDPKTRLYTYLLCGLRPEEIEPPLGWFQHTHSTKEETLTLVQSINRAISEEPLPETRVQTIFERFWPELQTKLDTMPRTSVPTTPQRSVQEMLAEILGLLRSDMATRADIQAFVDMLPVSGSIRQPAQGIIFDVQSGPNSGFYGKSGYGRLDALSGIGTKSSAKSTEAAVQPTTSTRNKQKL